MENKTLQNIATRLSATAVFVGAMDAPLFSLFFDYVERASVSAYARLVAELYRVSDGDLTALCKRIVFEDENVYIRALARRASVGKVIVASAERELAAFSDFASLTPADFAADLGVDEAMLPAFTSHREDLVASFMERASKIERFGYGIFTSHSMFRLSDDHRIEPIVSADRVSISHFVGYERERAEVMENTRAFLEGRPAANTLLCGDAGTGKSSTVKAIANEFFDAGLRLIELRKDQLSALPYVMGKISENPLHFIIFIDDLSFNTDDDNFSMLKAALEGSASAKAENAVIYATSTRRHIIRESFSDREGDDVHRADTLAETLSLSERFGLVVLFGKPDKRLYLQIVNTLARRAGITLPVAELETRAEAFALKKGNRSARCAEQFIESLL